MVVGVIFRLRFAARLLTRPCSGVDSPRRWPRGPMATMSPMRSEGVVNRPFGAAHSSRQPPSWITT